MHSLKPLGAVLHVLILTAAAVRGNDDFAQRQVLPSTETVEVNIRRTVTLGYEPYDPLAQQYSGNFGGGMSNGSLWFEWTAPRDGLFRAAASLPDESPWETYVYEGATLERLVRMQNGNREGMTWDQSTVFQARQSSKYVIAVRGLHSRTEVDRLTARLRIRPAADLPANETLVTRKVLSGTLPITVNATNFARPTDEAHHFERMARLDGYPYGSDPWGPALWWEWTCPAAATYELRPGPRSPGNVFFLGRRNPVIPLGGGGAGDWAPLGITLVNFTFTAEAGEVFDFALTSPRPDPGVTQQYGEVSFTLKEIIPFSFPVNTTEATALALPATLPLDYRYSWPGGVAPYGDYDTVRLWYRFTAPAEGYYEFTTGDAYLFYQRGSSVVHSNRNFQHLSAGEELLLYNQFSSRDAVNLVLKAEAVPAQPVADNFADAVDLGSASQFKLLGRWGQATLESGEPSPSYGLLTGSLWWRWTAPANGWLSVENGYSVAAGLEVFEGTTLTGLTGGIIPYDGKAVQAGRAYLIRAGFTDSPSQTVCFVTLAFYGEPSNRTWETALDLGTTMLPAWNSPSGPGWFYDDPVWVRWTALESLRGELTRGIPDDWVEIFTDPANGVILPRDPLPGTWQFIAGQTYWLRHKFYFNGTRWKMIHAPLTAHGDPGRALDLGQDLPVGGSISMSGDTNSPHEIAALSSVVPPTDLENWAAAVWWKWQCPRDQIIRCGTDDFRGYQPYGAFAFSGDDPAGDLTLEPFLPDAGDTPGSYLRVLQGRTYWFAQIGQRDAGGDSRIARLELRPVIETGPPNDSFAAAGTIAGDAWEYEAIHYGRHRNIAAPHPLRYEWMNATLEPGEPPVSLIIGAEGDAVPQTASTWWQWTAPAAGIYGLFTGDSDAKLTRNLRGSGPDVPEELMDLTVNVYTGDSLAALHPIPLYESIPGQYFFRAAAGISYTFRVASAAARDSYVLQCLIPTMDDCFNFWAIENLLFEDVGQAWASYAGDRTPNCMKLLFGMDYYLPATHPANVAAVQGKLPRQVINDGWLEMRCRPDPALVPAGTAANFGYLLLGWTSTDLLVWYTLYPMVAPGGEISLRIPMTGESRGFLQWDPLVLFE